MTDTTQERVCTDISDLFFNTDHDHAREYRWEGANRVFSGFYEADLIGDAAAFRECLQRLGVDCPSEEALVADFLGRQ